MGDMKAKGFTLIELVVSIAILVMVISFASVIFKSSISVLRTSTANTEIMQKLRAITDNLNSDFKGLAENSQGKTRFVLANGLRADCIAFLSTGDFYTTVQYGGQTVRGNIASIFYGQANNPNPISTTPQNKVLLRRQTILTNNPLLPQTDPNRLGEYATTSMAQWKVSPPVNDINRPLIDLNFTNYLAKGVDDFSVQFANWEPVQKKYNWWPRDNEVSTSPAVYLFTTSTKAIKFTFTLNDSRGIIKGGRRFTHIVYVGK